MNRQRGFAFLLQFLPYIIGFVLIAGCAYALYRKAHAWCNDTCIEVTQQRDELAEEKRQAQERATHLALAWAAEVEKAERVNHELAKERARAFGALVDRAKDVASRAPGGRGTVLADDVARLLVDASNEANASRPAAEREAVPAPVSDNWETWGVLAAQAYADAVGQHRACVDFYIGLQAAERKADVVAP